MASNVFYSLWCFIKFYVIGLIILIIEKVTGHKKFSVDNLSIPDGQVAILTGGDKGIGAETVKELAQLGIHVIIGTRNKDLAQKVVNEIMAKKKDAKVDILYLDVSSLKSVREFVSEFKKMNLPLHYLINNAGVMSCPRQWSEDGYEYQFACNYLGHFLLTMLLLDDLKATGTTERCSRVVHLSSEAHRVGYIDWVNLFAKKFYSPQFAYAQAKLAVLMFAFKLQRLAHTEHWNITSIAIHPGVVNTDLFRHEIPVKPLKNLVVKNICLTPRQGADAELRAALDPTLDRRGIQYLVREKQKKPTVHGLNIEQQDKLWRLSADMVGLPDLKKHCYWDTYLHEFIPAYANRAGGKLPEDFLRGLRMPEELENKSD